jgi:uncharacterized protein (DUF934 family)
MPKLIDTKGQLLDNGWQLQPRDATQEQVLDSTADQLLVNASLWLEANDALLASGKQFALWLDSDQPLTLIAETLPHVALVALNFPGFMDGRSYSKAVTLRRQYGYTGEIRAIGDVLRDQLFYMKRCGFSTFDLKDSVKLEDARRAFADFSTNYQRTVEEPLPLFRRRA